MGYPWFLIIVIIAFIVLSVWVGLYIIVTFQHPEDKHMGWFTKFLGMSAFACSTMNVLMLSIDAINRSSNNQLKIDIMCWVFTIMSAALSFVVLPFSIFYYERRVGEDSKHPLCCSIGSTIGCIFTFAIVLVIFYFGAAHCEIPIEVQLTNFSDDPNISVCEYCKMSKATWNITPSFLSFIITAIGFFGYLFLIIIGGPGLATLPINLISTFLNRPRAINAQTYARAKRALNGWAEELKVEGETLQQDVRAKGRNHKTVAPRLIRFDDQVERLESTYRTVEVMYKVKGGNPLWPWCCLFLGIISIILTIVWIIHVVFYYILDINPMLNNFLTILDDAFPYAAVFFFAIFTFYLYLSVLSGCTTFGLNFFCCRLHPMEKDNTPITSILFNACIMLIASFGVALFSTMNFPIYTRLTSLDMLYGVQVQTMKGIKYVWEYGVYVMFATFLIGLVFKLCTCRKKDNKMEILNDCFSHRAEAKKINP